MMMMMSGLRKIEKGPPLTRGANPACAHLRLASSRLMQMRCALAAVLAAASAPPARAQPVLPVAPPFDFAPRGGPATFTSELFGLAAAPSGIFYVSDGSNRILAISPAGAVTPFAGNGTRASVDGVGTAAAFNFGARLGRDSPGCSYHGALAVGVTGTLFVAECGRGGREDNRGQRHDSSYRGRHWPTRWRLAILPRRGC